AWGNTVAVSPPRGASTSWNLVGNGQAGRLDLLGSFSLNNSANASTWHTQVLPGLLLSATRTHLRVGARHPEKVTFFVSDAGAPVSGAVVRVGRVSGRTNGNGKVTLALGPFARKTHLHAHASLNGYVAAALTLKVG